MARTLLLDCKGFTYAAFWFLYKFAVFLYDAWLKGIVTSGDINTFFKFVQLHPVESTSLQRCHRTNMYFLFLFFQILCYFFFPIFVPGISCKCLGLVFCCVLMVHLLLV